MALPSGYSKIDYIEATGTQYINTYFTPDGNSRIVMDFESAAVSSTVALFGARTASSENVFGMWLDAGKAQPQYGSVSYATKPIAITNTVRQTYELNKGVATVGGTSVTFDNLSFSAGQPLTLFAMNSGGSVDGRRASGKLYSCKIYNNGTLVRDFVPCKADGGELGLFDLVESVFYGNSGTGTLTTGNKHKTLIGGTGYEIKSGRVLIGGTGYDIKSGRTLIDGTGYGISFSTPAGDLAIGSSVYMNIDGARTEFIIVQQGKPDASVYDDTCNGTWLLAKNIYSMYYVGLSGYSKWRYAPAQEYANGTFLGLFEPWVQSLIKSVNFPDGHNRTDTAVTEYKITVPHPCELGYTGYTYKLTTLDFFKNSTMQLSATYNGTAESYFLRKTSAGSSQRYYWHICTSDGAIAEVSNGTYTEIGFRPLLVIPQDALVNGSLDLIQS